ncbi:MAG: hypothetical protein Q8P59_13750, partial [Dehalococcoidia bacterium]|nr:hypothetical protein [Dehalococcoidia bacterium]
MKGTKGAIWRGLAFVTILALILGALPVTPTQAATGDTKDQAEVLWTAGGPAVSRTVTWPSSGEYWYSIGYGSGATGVRLTITPNAISSFEVFHDTETVVLNPGSPNIWDIPAGSPTGSYFVKAKTISIGLQATITAAPMAGSSAPTQGDGSYKHTPIFLTLGTPSNSSINPPTQNTRWFSHNYDGTHTVNVELQGDPALNINVYKGSNTWFEPGGSYVKFFSLNGASNAGQYFFEVVCGCTSGTQSFTVSAHTGSGGGAVGDSRANPDVMSGALPVTRNITSTVSSKWFSRDFTGTHDLEISINTPVQNVQLFVYQNPNTQSVNGSNGGKFFKLPQNSPIGTYLFEVRNVTGVSFGLTVSAPMAGGGCTEFSPCPLNADSPFHGNVAPNGATWLRYNHTDASRRAKLTLNSPSGSINADVRQGSTTSTPVATVGGMGSYPLGNATNTWYFKISGGYMGGDFDVQVVTESNEATIRPGGGDNQFSAAGVNMGDFRTGQLSPQQGTWFRFGFFGEPARIIVETQDGGAPDLSIYYGYSPNALYSNLNTAP